MIQAIVTDVEGTTTSIAFVHDVLFPYARRELPNYIADNVLQPDIRTQLESVEKEVGQPINLQQATEQLLEWMEQDKKCTPLKTLQGMVWEHGYLKGDFKGHVYEDAQRNLQHWNEQGIKLYIYSSGSVQAQKLLFSHTDRGDMTSLFRGYFDTHIGAKKDVDSYRRIINEIKIPADSILFLSDMEYELEAAQAAGLKTLLLVRDDIEYSGKFMSVRDFDHIDLDQFN